MKKELIVSYELYDSWKELSQADQELVEKAYGVAQHAYAPFSNFNVGAAVLLEDGTVILGSNQENVAFPSGLCAERTALFYTGANYPGVNIEKMVIVAKGNFVEMNTLLAPCGGCRQVMMESETRQEKPIQVIVVSQNNKTFVVNAVRDLVPFAFIKA